ncbi:MAG: response regulator transcription factor [Leptolyngbyaceae cyanobacterium SL_7_1]|nr:response regulator transcription factor [Leptolyngbyaceae cyanobacterium SL_7_1]
MAPEFLEVLQMLCTISAIALDTALHYQKEKQTQQTSGVPFPSSASALSDQLVQILRSTRLTLVGTEHSLSPSIAFTIIQTAEILQQLGCTYCRLIYAPALVVLEAVLPFSPALATNLPSTFNSLGSIAACLGGKVETQIQDNQRAIQMVLEIPELPPDPSRPAIHIRCTTPILQLALTQLSRLAGLTLHQEPDADVPLLTDDPTQVNSTSKILWLQQGTQPPPKGVQAIVSLSTTADQLQQAVVAVRRGEQWGISAPVPAMLSDRELEILQLLTQGLRDRDIADQLVISESTVKFHMNNVLTKLKARTRYQAIHQAAVQGWL